MTIAELIEFLKTMPQDANVVFSIPSNGSYPDDEYEVVSEDFRYRKHDNTLDLNAY